MMSKIKNQLEQLKDQRVVEILSDESLSKIEKLRTIEEERLWGFASSIQHEFKEWETEAVKLEKKEAERIFKEQDTSIGKGDICLKQIYFSKMTDSIFDPSHMYYERYQQVSYAEVLAGLFDVDNENAMVEVITTRHPVIQLKKSYNEIVDKVFDFAVKNKIVGFTNDW